MNIFAFYVIWNDIKCKYIHDILMIGAFDAEKIPGHFEIPHKLSYPYIERYDFYTTLKF